MSRSRKKVGRYGWCVGSNTSFYKAKRRAMRRLFNTKFKTLLASFSIADVADKLMHIRKNELIKYSDWNSPTDGYGYIRREPTEEWEKKIFRK